jgi:exopolysaccharide biosynthesis polyprenyl glycosylphosphotransferase
VSSTLQRHSDLSLVSPAPQARVARAARPEPQPLRLRGVIMCLDAFLTALGLLASYYLRVAITSDPPVSLLAHLALLPVIVPLWLVLLMFFNAYRRPGLATLVDFSWSVARAVAAGLVLLLTLLFLLKVHHISRAIVVLFVGLDFVALTAVRFVILGAFQRAARTGDNLRRVLVVGTGSRAGRLARAVTDRPDLAISIVGYLDTDATQVGRPLLGSTIIGTIDEIPSILRDHIVDEVILAVPGRMLPTMASPVRACEREGIALRVMSDFFDINAARLTLERIGDIPLLRFESVAHDEWKLVIKRIMDVLITLLAMPVLLPVLAALAIAIKLDSPGPVLFIQDRVGLYRRRFRMLKFRTMVDGSERMQEEFEHLNQIEGPVFKIFNDPRVTRVGRFLRRTSLDELPQLLNVLKGDMSLVGPRPLPLRDVNRFDQASQRKRFVVKPGLTCLWQVSGRSTLPFTEWLRLDLWYIDNWSLSLDVKLLLRTIPVVLRGTGAA